MSGEFKIATVSEGASLEPSGWFVYNRDDPCWPRALRYEQNPNYVAPPEPTELELEEQALENLESRVEDQRRYVETLRAEAATAHPDSPTVGGAD